MRDYVETVKQDVRVIGEMQIAFTDSSSDKPVTLTHSLNSCIAVILNSGEQSSMYHAFKHNPEAMEWMIDQVQKLGQPVKAILAGSRCINERAQAFRHDIENTLQAKGVEIHDKFYDEACPTHKVAYDVRDKTIHFVHSDDGFEVIDKLIQNAKIARQRGAQIIQKGRDYCQFDDRHGSPAFN